jgi:hypothetical protein
VAQICTASLVRLRAMFWPSNAACWSLLSGALTSRASDSAPHFVYYVNGTIAESAFVSV